MTSVDQLARADSDGNLWVGGDVGLARIHDSRLAEFIDADAPGGPHRLDDLVQPQSR